MRFWELFRNKKGEKEMDEQKQVTSNQQINDEETSQIFQGFESEYAALKKSIARELSDYRDMLTRERNQLNVYKNKVQVRDVMEELLPILSDIKNDVLDSTNLDDLKEAITIRFKQLKNALKRVGIELQAHERKQPIETNEKINVSPKVTVDRNLHYKVACSTKMGCIIRGEEDNPILEDIELFKYEKQAVPNNGYTTRDSSSRPPMTEPQSQQSYEDLDRTVSCQQPQRREDLPCAQVAKPDFTPIAGNAIRLEKALTLKPYSGGDIPLFNEGVRSSCGEWQRCNIPIARMSAKENFYVYFGTKLIRDNLELQGVNLAYRIDADQASNAVILTLVELDSQSYIRNQLLQIRLNK